MAHHGYLELEGGELLVRFIVQNCALPDTYQVPRTIILALCLYQQCSLSCGSRLKSRISKIRLTDFGILDEHLRGMFDDVCVSPARTESHRARGGD